MVTVLVGYVVLGAVAGWVWELLWDPPLGVVTRSGWVLPGGELGERFQAAALFVVIGAVVGVAAAGGAVWLLRRRPWWMVGTVTLGAAAATAVMLWVGTSLGPPDPATVAGGVSPGTTVPGSLELHGSSPLLVLLACSLSVVTAVLLTTTGPRPQEAEPAG